MDNEREGVGVPGCVFPFFLHDVSALSFLLTRRSSLSRPSARSKSLRSCTTRTSSISRRSSLPQV
jgi:hypothetical protein